MKAFVGETYRALLTIGPQRDIQSSASTTLNMTRNEKLLPEPDRNVRLRNTHIINECRSWWILSKNIFSTMGTGWKYPPWRRKQGEDFNNWGDRIRRDSFS